MTKAEKIECRNVDMAREVARNVADLRFSEREAWESYLVQLDRGLYIRQVIAERFGK